MKVGSLFSGYGGLDLGVCAAVGGSVAWHAEVDPHASAVLNARFPDVPNLGDVAAVDWSAVEPVDVLCGGFPCQDVSSAGARRGLRPGTRSGLWAAMAGAVDALRPRLVVVENVRGLLSACAHSDLEPCPGCVGDGDHDPVLRALGRVLGDLADLGFDAEWGVLSAAAVGACHRRERVFVVAWPAADTDSAGRVRVAGASVGRHAALGHVGGDVDGRCGVAGPLTLLPTPTSRDHKGRNQRNDATCLQDALDLRTVVTLLPTPTARLGDSRGAQAKRYVNSERSNDLDDAVAWCHEDPSRWGRYAAAIARHEQVFGRPVPEPRNDGRLSARFVEWMMMLPEGWVTDVLPRRPALRCLGNGVVPAQATAAVAALCVRLGAAA